MFSRKHQINNLSFKTQETRDYICHIFSFIRGLLRKGSLLILIFGESAKILLSFKHCKLLKTVAHTQSVPLNLVDKFCGPQNCEILTRPQNVQLKGNHDLLNLVRSILFSNLNYYFKKILESKNSTESQQKFLEK